MTATTSKQAHATGATIAEALNPGWGADAYRSLIRQHEREAAEWKRQDEEREEEGGR